MPKANLLLANKIKKAHGGLSNHVTLSKIIEAQTNIDERKNMQF